MPENDYSVKGKRLPSQGRPADILVSAGRMRSSRGGRAGRRLATAPQYLATVAGDRGPPGGRTRDPRHEADPLSFIYRKHPQSAGPRERLMPNIKTVAEAAGVSVATVSRVLNGKQTVARELADRVHEAATAVGYRPNVIARSLRTQSTKTIALVIPDISNPFFTSVARGVEDTAQRAGYSVLLCNTDEDRDKERDYLVVAEQAQVDGVVLSPHDRSTDITSLRRDGVPVVVIDRALREPTDLVDVRSFQGARDATRHLIEQGWSRPACITGPPYAATATARLRGYRAAIAEHDGMTARVEHADFRQDGGQAAAARLFDTRTPPDAIFVANAQMTLGVLAELSRRALGVGVDVGIVTFDDAPWAPHINPPITVVSQPAYEVGRRATDLLLDSIQGRDPGKLRHVTLTPELIIRRSSLRLAATTTPGQGDVVGVMATRQPPAAF